MIRKLGMVFVIFVFSGAGISFAQGDPASLTGGVVERAAQQKPVRRVPVDNIPQIESQSEAMPMEDNGSTVVIENFVFDGNESISSDELDPIVEPYRFEHVTFADLGHICRKIRQYYQLKGFFLVRVYLPPQDISLGMMRIQIIEGKIGAIRVRGNEGMQPGFISTRLYTEPIAPGVQYNGLLKSLILLNEYPSFKIKTTLAKGERPGTTDIVVDVVDRRRVTAGFWMHNGGPRFVSELIFGQKLGVFDSLRTGDALTAYSSFGTPARNLRVAGLNYTTPINTYHTKLTAGYSYSDFHAQRAISDLGVRGVSQTGNLGVIHPLIRTLDTKLDARVGFTAKDIKNFTLNEQSSHDRLRIVEVGFDQSYKDHLGGRTWWRNTFSAGIPHFMGSNDANDVDMSRFGSGGRFFKWSGELSRMQNLPLAATLLLRGNYQLAADTLPASEEISIGGIDSVRGYPQAEYLGDNGYYVNVELRLPPYGLRDMMVPIINKPLQDIVQFAGFLDYGEAYRKSFLPGEFPDRALMGVGYGLRFFVSDWANISLDWAYPVGKKETSDGSESSFYVKVNVDL